MMDFVQHYAEFNQCNMVLVEQFQFSFWAMVRFDVVVAVGVAEILILGWSIVNAFRY